MSACDPALEKAIVRDRVEQKGDADAAKRNGQVVEIAVSTTLGQRGSCGDIARKRVTDGVGGTFNLIQISANQNNLAIVSRTERPHGIGDSGSRSAGGRNASAGS